ncbi:MAG: hypothetical protein R3C14_22765 [Caldilineaceae bacterium]
MKRTGQALLAIVIVVVFLVQCARDDLFVQNRETGEYQSLLTVLVSDAMYWASENLFIAATPFPTLVPTATPATPQARIAGYLRELTINLARLERDSLRIESNRNDNETVAVIGTSIALTSWVLENMEPPSKVDSEQVGIAEDYTEAHKWLLDVLHPCRIIGSYAMNGEPGETMVSNILQAHDECKERIQFLKGKYPHLFVCPVGETYCR